MIGAYVNGKRMPKDYILQPDDKLELVKSTRREQRSLGRQATHNIDIDVQHVEVCKRGKAEAWFSGWKHRSYLTKRFFGSDNGSDKEGGNFRKSFICNSYGDACGFPYPPLQKPLVLQA